MKKMSFRMRTTLLTAVCLAIACFAMYASLLWLADAQIVQVVEFGPVNADISKSETTVNDSQFTDGIAIGEELPMDGNSVEELYGLLAQSGLQKFKVLGILVMLLVILSGSGLAWIVSGISIAPVKQLSDKLEAIDARQMNLDVSEFCAGDELNKLADSFSRMMERIQTAFMREKRFSMAAAHELKTPLAAMQSSLDILELSDEPSVEEYREAIADIDSQVNRLTALVTDLLLLARAGKMEVTDQTDVSDAVENIIEEISACYPDKQIEKNITPVTIETNRVLFERAVYNLLENAAKYSPAKSKIKISLFRDKNQCILKIADGGFGISEEAAAHIFEPFYREELSRNRSIAGAGLGLSFVKEFAETCGGQITFAPVQPCGTEFTLILPLKQNASKLS